MTYPHTRQALRVYASSTVRFGRVIDHRELEELTDSIVRVVSVDDGCLSSLATLWLDGCPVNSFISDMRQHYESRACRRFQVRFALVEKPSLIFKFTDLFARAVGPNHSGPGAHPPGPEGRYGRPTTGKPGGAPRAERKEKPHAITRARRTKRDAVPGPPAPALARGGANGRLGRVMPRPAASPPQPSRAATTRCIPRRAKSPVACTRGGPAPAPNRQWAIGT